jgi:integrase
MSRFMGWGGYQKMTLRTTVRRMTRAPKGATRFQNGVVALALVLVGGQRPDEAAQLGVRLLDVVAREMRIVATKQVQKAQMAVQKFWAISLG